MAPRSASDRKKWNVILLATFKEVDDELASVVTVTESAGDSVDEASAGSRKCMATTGSREEAEEAAVSRFTA